MESLGSEAQELKASLNWIVAKKQAREAREKRSVLSSHKSDDPAVWSELKRKLRKEGISDRVLLKHKITIVEYVKELGERGVLDDPVEVPTDSISIIREVAEVSGITASIGSKVTALPPDFYQTVGRTNKRITPTTESEVC